MSVIAKNMEDEDGYFFLAIHCKWKRNESLAANRVCPYYTKLIFQS